LDALRGDARFLALGALGALTAVSPSKPIVLVVPAGTGGTLDAIARGLQAELQKRLGQPVVIENRAGAAGAIGGAAVASSSPDGHTLLLGTSFNLAVQPALAPKFPYKPGR